LVRSEEPGLHSSILAAPLSSYVRYINSYASLTRNGLPVAKKLADAHIETSPGLGALAQFDELALPMLTSPFIAGPRQL
jgi:hypothetical protein